eukprot:13177064-Alexandrium_andersonii.AAC.1
MGRAAPDGAARPHRGGRWTATAAKQYALPSRRGGARSAQQLRSLRAACAKAGARPRGAPGPLQRRILKQRRLVSGRRSPDHGAARSRPSLHAGAARSGMGMVHPWARAPRGSLARSPPAPETAHRAAARARAERATPPLNAGGPVP